MCILHTPYKWSYVCKILVLAYLCLWHKMFYYLFWPEVRVKIPQHLGSSHPGLQWSARTGRETAGFTPGCCWTSSLQPGTGALVPCLLLCPKMKISIFSSGLKIPEGEVLLNCLGPMFPIVWMLRGVSTEHYKMQILPLSLDIRGKKSSLQRYRSGLKIEDKCNVHKRQEICVNWA